MPFGNVLFECDATQQTGFGHLSRCLGLARRLSGRRASLRITFRGTLADQARRMIEERLPTAEWCAADSRISPNSFDLAVLDALADAEDPDTWDPQRLKSLQAAGAEVVMICSGIKAPRLPPDSAVHVVGYQPGGPIITDDLGAPARMRWDLGFAPNDTIANEPSKRRAGRVAIALGGAETQSVADTIVKGLADSPDVKDIVYLGSPLACLQPDKSFLRPEQKFEVLRNLPSMDNQIQAAELLVVAYGNMMFEALGLCTPCVVTGVKAFQRRYARNIADRGLAVAIDTELSPGAVQKAVAAAMAAKEGLARACAQTFPVSGMERLAEYLLAFLPIPSRA